MAGFITFYFFIKDEKQKSIYFKYCALLCVLNNLPIIYCDYMDWFFLNQGDYFQIPQFLFMPAFCNICMYMGLYFAFAKNKHTAIYGILAMFFVGVASFGGLTSTTL
jgi:hypothetical protein